MSNSPSTPTPSSTSTTLSREIKVFGAIAVVLFIASQLIPHRFVSGISLLGAIWTGWMFLMGWSGFVGSKLEGLAKIVFQVIVAVVFPLMASLYFLADVTTTDNIFAGITLYTFVPVAIIAYLSWVLADQLNRDVPLTGFLATGSVLFVLCFMLHNGAVTEESGLYRAICPFIFIYARFELSSSKRHHRN